MQHPPYGILVWLLIMLLNRSVRQEKKQPRCQAKNIGNSPHNIEQFSNGRKIEPSHIFYYLDVLDLLNKEKINERTIERATWKKRQSLDSDIEQTKTISRTEIVAAEHYLIDRCRYISYLN